MLRDMLVAAVIIVVTGALISVQEWRRTSDLHD